MKKQMTTKQKSKAIDADLLTLKDAINALEEVLQQSDYEIGEVADYCDEIEQLAIAIRESVEEK